MDSRLRERFDDLLEKVLGQLPEELRHLMDETPLVVDDTPPPEVLRSVKIGRRSILCGLYTGVPLTGRSVEFTYAMPETIRIFRQGIIQTAVDETGQLTDENLMRQIRITVLHEMGHHFGLDEDDLKELGYS